MPKKAAEMLEMPRQEKQFTCQLCLLADLSKALQAMHDLSDDTHAHLVGEKFEVESSDQALQALKHGDLLPIPKHTPEIMHSGQLGRHGLYAL